MSELPQTTSSASRKGEDCNHFKELPSKELPMKEWFSVFTEADA